MKPMFKWVGVCLLAAPLAQAAAEPSSAQVRERLARMAVPVEAASMVQYAAQGDVNMVKLLLAAGLGVSVRDPVRGVTALHNAAAQGQLPTLDLLLRLQPEVDAQDWRGLTPLINAVHGGHGAAVERLLKAGARVDVSPAQGPTALLAAVHAGRMPIVRQLLDAGANPNQADAFGTTPLDAARRTGLQSIVELFQDR